LRLSQRSPERGIRTRKLKRELQRVQRVLMRAVSKQDVDRPSGGLRRRIDVPVPCDGFLQVGDNVRRLQRCRKRSNR
jgi:hypothetical protein